MSQPHDSLFAMGEDGLAAQQFVERANANAAENRYAINLINNV